MATTAEHAREVNHHGPGPVVVLRRVVDVLFDVLYALLLLRFLLEFVNASPDAGFTVLIDRLTFVFYAPFRHIVESTMVGPHPIVWSLLIAVLAYMVAHAALHAVLGLASRR